VPIHTVAPDNVEYIRVTKDIQGYLFEPHLELGTMPEGTVGKVVSRGKGSGRVQPNLVIAIMVGYGEKVFNTEQTELITEKDYFVGALSGGRKKS